MPSTALGVGDTAVKKTDEVLVSRNLWSKWRETDNIKWGYYVFVYLLEKKINQRRRTGVIDVCYLTYTGQGQPL